MKWTEAALYTAAIMADTLGATANEVVERLELDDDDRLWVEGVVGFETGVPPRPSSEGWTRAQAERWQHGWDHAWRACEYRAEAWPDYQPTTTPPASERDAVVTFLRGCETRARAAADKFGGATTERRKRDFAIGTLTAYIHRIEEGDHLLPAEVAP